MAIEMVDILKVRISEDIFCSGSDVTGMVVEYCFFPTTVFLS
jgi:hypothetical protein